MPDMDLTDLMKDSGLTPTQKQVYADNLNEYAEAMRQPPDQPGAWDWNKTAQDLQSPMVKDSQGNIVSGHHRFVAAEIAGITIPEGVVKVSPRPTTRIPRPWGNVTVMPGRRP